ncbi:hypothetical protein [Methylobacter psychrophilus]|uniref:hypothetical protein n=1 Tax=Methylobacter psychrophilus TaxID=96941 RepID=UPI0021D4E033|nr:hypothetical protein [Methylobacter psychrophilus]
MDRLGTTRQEPGSKNKQPLYSIKTRLKLHIIAIVINLTAVVFIIHLLSGGS